MEHARRYWVAIAVLTIGWSSACMATDVSGISLGHPLNMAECSKRQGDYLSDDHEQCFKWPAGTAQANNMPADGQLIVNVPRQDRPNYMDGSDAVVELKDGKVTSVSIRTHGAEGESEDYHWLKLAFGEPDSKPIYQNVQPNQFYAMLASWSLSDGVTVYYNSGEFGTYYGLVRVQLPSASKHQLGTWD